MIVSDEDEEAYLCACKHTGNAPYCDGTHQQFNADEVGKEGPGVTSKSSDLPKAKSTIEEPTVEFIHQLAREGLSKLGHHGQMTAMGVPRHELPHRDDLQINGCANGHQASAGFGYKEELLNKVQAFHFKGGQGA